VDAPLAAWRVHSCAARAAAAHGHQEAALDHRARAASIIKRLADSMPAASDLRRTFLDSRDVQAILASSAV